MNRVIKEVIFDLKSNVSTFLFCFVCLFGVYFLVTSVFVIYKNTSSYIDSLGEGTGFKVYLSDNILENDIEKLKSEIFNESNKIKKVNFISKKESLDQFKNSFGSTESFNALSEIGNPLPHSFSILIDEIKFSGDWIHSLAKKIKEKPGVSEVFYGQEWLNQYASFKSSLSFGFLSFQFFTILLVLVLISFIVFQIVDKKRQEISIKELLGESHLKIRMPIILQVLILNISATLMAVFLAYLSYLYMITSDLFIGTNFDLFNFSFLNSFELCVFMIFSFLVGLACGLFSLQRLNDGWLALKK